MRLVSRCVNYAQIELQKLCSQFALAFFQLKIVKALRTINGNQADLTPIYLDEFATLNHKGGIFLFLLVLINRLKNDLRIVLLQWDAPSALKMSRGARESLSNCEL